MRQKNQILSYKLNNNEYSKPLQTQLQDKYSYPYFFKYLI